MRTQGWSNSLNNHTELKKNEVKKYHLFKVLVLVARFKQRTMEYILDISKTINTLAPGIFPVFSSFAHSKILVFIEKANFALYKRKVEFQENGR